MDNGSENKYIDNLDADLPGKPFRNYRYLTDILPVIEEKVREAERAASAIASLDREPKNANPIPNLIELLYQQYAHLFLQQQMYLRERAHYDEGNWMVPVIDNNEKLATIKDKIDSLESRLPKKTVATVAYAAARSISQYKESEQNQQPKEFLDPVLDAMMQDILKIEPIFDIILDRLRNIPETKDRIQYLKPYIDLLARFTRLYAQLENQTRYSGKQWVKQDELDRILDLERRALGAVRKNH
jgi:hypothetical protein